MRNKLILIIVMSIFLVSLVAAQSVSYCCEKTESGAWCQNAPENQCDDGFRKTPTHCESTSYCRKGCCYNSQEGTCAENSPEKVCQDKGGVWEATADCDIPQCELGCCLIGDQAAFVTQTRCKRLAALYGLEINFRTDISNEIQCIASVTSEVKGACVFEREFEKTCSFITQRECQEMGTGGEGASNVEFHKDYLCSAETLGTDCGPSEKTTCVEGRDEVYFLDTCGNLANIYDASKIKNKEYWTKIYRKDESCGAGSANANSKTCGNCDYFLGSVCKDYKRGEDMRPSHGDKICRDLSCEYEGKKYSHGETWCAESKGTDKNLPGSRYFRLVCYSGDVTVEPCADFRQEICLQDSIDGWKTAGCVVNQWQDCVSQDNKKDCENTDRRDCIWSPPVGTEIKKDGTNEKLVNNASTACVPKYAPGFDFWESESEAESFCSIADKTCTIVYEKGLIGGKDCKENCECEDEEAWKDSQEEKLCIKLGDCGAGKNYIGIQGYEED